MSKAVADPDSQTPDYFKRAFPDGVLKQWVVFKLFRVMGFLLRHSARWFKSFRLPFTDVVVVTGFDGFQEVFTRWQDFPTPNNHKIDALGWTPPYLLGLPDEDGNFDEMHALTRELFADNTLKSQLQKIAREAFEDLLPNPPVGGWTEVDLTWGYLYPGFLSIVRDYYGIRIADENAVRFVSGMMVVSAFLFAKPDLKKGQKADDDVLEAFHDVWKLVEEQVNAPRDGQSSSTVLDLARTHRANLDTQALTSYFVGMIMGFIPTNGNAHQRITEVLFSNPTARACADRYCSVEANEQKDAEFLAVLHECLRMNYILPNLWRIARGTDLTIGEGKHKRRIADGAHIAASGMAAMFDPDQFDKPHEFRSDRSYWSYLNYGHRLHFCVGWDLSNIIMIEFYRALVIREFEPVLNGRKVLRTLFPWHYDVRYRAPKEP